MELPASLTSIVSNPFRHCKSLTRFTGDNPYISDEGNYLSTSEGRLFSYACASTTGEFVIPESITTIGDYAMSSASFSSVKMMSLTPPTLGSYAFDGIDEFDIMIPDVAFSDYQAAPGWSRAISSITNQRGQSGTRQPMARLFKIRQSCLPHVR